MNVLEKILKEIEERGNIQFSSYTKPLIAVEDVLEIIRSHMDEIPNCEGCSRRKWYQKGFEDGKKDNDWIPVEEKLPEKEVIAQNVYNEMMIGYVYYSEEMEWYGCESDDVYLSNVVAWRPLLETYKKHRQ